MNSGTSTSSGSASASVQWTAAQVQAIGSVGSSLLVSAAAGSGKTSVLAERCVQLLCDEKAGCEVGDLLVVTFTEAAAAEMKDRIARALSKRHASSPGELTARHLAMLDRASIGTLHGFCSRVLRQNFHLLGIDPEFRILDGDEARLLKIEVSKSLFADRYDDPEDHAFRKTIDLYADGDDERLSTQVIRAYDTLCSVIDPPKWLDEARSRIDEAIDLPMDQSALGKTYLQLVRRELRSVMQSCEAAGKFVKAMGKFPSYVDDLRSSYFILKHWSGVLDSHGLDALREEVDGQKFDRLAPVSGLIEGKDIAKDRVDAIRDEMKNGSWRKNLTFTVDEWKEGLQATVPHVDVFLSLVSDFAQRYSTEKDEHGWLDFADLEQLTLRALRAPDSGDELLPSPLARHFHHQFKHVLVDEYQDINGVQDAILKLTSRECLNGKGTLPSNLFCVGDVKQSIYRFRLADPNQFLDRRGAFSRPDATGAVIDLKENFRSRGPLLEVINSVFERLMTRAAAEIEYDSSQKLVAKKAYANVSGGFIGSPIELHLLNRDKSARAEGESSEPEADLPDREAAEREAIVLGRRILEMMGRTDKPAMRVVDSIGGNEIDRPIRYSDIVILLRAMQFKADQFAAALRQMGVPVHTDSATGYFEATEVNDILSLLHVLDNQRQDIPLAAVLRSPLARSGDSPLARNVKTSLNGASNRSSSDLPNPEDMLARIRLAYPGEPPVPFHLAVQRYADEQTDEIAAFLKTFRAKLHRWRQEIHQRPVAEMLWKIYDETGYLTYVTGLPDGEQRQANLIDLFDRARQFGTFERQGLGKFLKFLEKLKEETDLGRASVASEADDVVRIMSIHKSKGKEFPVVMLPDLGKAFNLRDGQGSILLDREAGLGMQVVDERRQVRYPSLAWTVVQQRLRQQSLAEELRVLYVAMTRAKEHLILAGTCSGDKLDAWAGQWANHTGPLPAEAVLAARNPLDWVGPVATILPDQIALTMHTADEIAKWAGDHAGSAVISPAQIALADEQPLSPPPVVTAETQKVIDRLGFIYPFNSVAHLSAAASVTNLVKKTRAAVINNVAEGNGISSTPLDRMLAHPGFLTGKLPLDAADRGTATHTVLEHFDFNPQAASIAEQVKHLVFTRRLSPDLAELVDMDAIDWFLKSEIGRLLQAHSHHLQRELPVYYANPSDASASTDPMDQQMVRGRIDLLVPVDGRWMIVDYKTDRVTGEALEERVTLYTGQLDIYRKAVQQITGKPVMESVLVFLTPRVIRRI